MKKPESIKKTKESTKEKPIKINKKKVSEIEEKSKSKKY